MKSIVAAGGVLKTAEASEEAQRDRGPISNIQITESNLF